VCSCQSFQAPKSDNEVQVDYTDVAALKALLDQHQVNTVISTIQLLAESSADAEKNLVQAAAASSVTKRFVPSVWATPAPAE